MRSSVIPIAEAAPSWQQAFFEHPPWWPIMAFSLGVVVLFALKKDISGFLSRMRKVGAGSFSAEGPLPAQVVEKSPDVDLPSPLGTSSPVPPYPESPLLVEEEAEIRATLHRSAGRASPDQFNWLVSALASERSLHRWEATYRVIFGSQIALLGRLNAAVLGLSREEAKSHFLYYQKVRPKLSGSEFDGWVGWLIESHLVALDGERFVITTAGQEFLTWMVRARVANDRVA